jgi:3-phenylpropionate/trans-cinnamate dioxygenase ferredoxin subunit
MSIWIDVCATQGINAGEHLLIDVDGVEVAVFNIAGQFFAIENICSHDGSEIASGKIDGAEIICPRHGARFCLKTGAVKCAPAYEDIASYAVQEVDGRILVGY